MCVCVCGVCVCVCVGVCVCRSVTLCLSECVGGRCVCWCVSEDTVFVSVCQCVFWCVSEDAVFVSVCQCVCRRVSEAHLSGSAAPMQTRVLDVGAGEGEARRGLAGGVAAEGRVQDSLVPNAVCSEPGLRDTPGRGAGGNAVQGPDWRAGGGREGQFSTDNPPSECTFIPRKLHQYRQMGSQYRKCPGGGNRIPGGTGRLVSGVLPPFRMRLKIK